MLWQKRSPLCVWIFFKKQRKSQIGNVEEIKDTFRSQAGEPSMSQ